ncbi:hypothetical protein M404DRAFT_33032 [Pisolithus tinctorius Marx 270]|uniref:Uncharacterized protein n=1 Tax=Pisolithus tinctorius Marx 270 TaxID=870435 RepID=A0A0C3N6J8_PISTI|nr:hypothetical protein M404DRAFT_33032 [Pisolithus tinctorius Marx 270]
MGEENEWLLQVTENLALEFKIVNGVQGVLRDIVYEEVNGVRIARCAIDHGDGHAAKKLVLTCGGDIYDSVWKNQIDSHNLAATFTSKSLQMPLHHRYNSNRLFLQWQVYSASAPSSTMTATTTMCIDSQSSHVDSVQRIHEEGTLFHMDDCGQVSPLCEDSLNHRDFVEVDIEFDLVITRDDVSYTSLKVYLSFKDIVWLLPASNPSLSVSSKCKRDGVQPPSSTLIKHMRTGTSTENVNPNLSPQKALPVEKSYVINFFHNI